MQAGFEVRFGLFSSSRDHAQADRRTLADYQYQSRSAHRPPPRDARRPAIAAIFEGADHWRLDFIEPSVPVKCPANFICRDPYRARLVTCSLPWRRVSCPSGH